MKKLNKTPLATAVGTLLISGFSINASAEASPFAMTELSSGYMQVAENLNNKVTEGGCGSNTGGAGANAKKSDGASAKKADGSCGEGKCGAMMNGGKMKQGMESVCGAMMKNKEGSCGMNGNNPAPASKNGKAAEASCGAMMGGNKAGEASCGSMMKGAEGSCGSKVEAGKASGK